MSDYQYLKPEQHYIDLYDQATIERCRRWPGGVVFEVAIHFYTGERALDKEETVRKWMQEDQVRDEKLETTEPPE